MPKTILSMKFLLPPPSSYSKILQQFYTEFLAFFKLSARHTGGQYHRGLLKNE
jgi:hypothetical protein